jgi:hypothetical protein
MTTPPKPIFVIGRHRSGTTWLSNILAALPGVYGPRHESAYFSHLVPYCNHGRTPADLLTIKRLFEASEFFARTGLAAGPDILGLSGTGYFRRVMDEAAASRQASYWIEKTPAHTLRVRMLARAFPDAIVLAVTRNYRDVVASNVHGFGRPSSVWSWLRQSAATAIYEKIILSNGVFTVKYENLQSDYDRTVRSVMSRIGLGSQPVPANSFSRNTSFAGHAPRISWWQAGAMRAGRWMIWIWPSALVERVTLLMLAGRKGHLPGWFFPSASG